MLHVVEVLELLSCEVFN